MRYPPALVAATLIGSTGMSPPVTAQRTPKFVSVTTGTNHTCALTEAGAAYCWGDNRFGQLGNGGTAESPIPVLVAGGHSFVSLRAGSTHTCAMTRAGKAWCWGSNLSGKLGDFSGENSNVPVAVSGGLTFSSLVAGVNISCGLTAAAAGGGNAGVTYCWGGNSEGNLATGPRPRATFRSRSPAGMGSPSSAPRTPPVASPKPAPPFAGASTATGRSATAPACRDRRRFRLLAG